MKYITPEKAAKKILTDNKCEAEKARLRMLKRMGIEKKDCSSNTARNRMIQRNFNTKK